MAITAIDPNLLTIAGNTKWHVDEDCVVLSGGGSWIYAVPKDSIHLLSPTTTPPYSPTTSPELAREKALAYIGEARAAVHAKKLTKLPRGRVQQGRECVLARALPHCHSVSARQITFNKEKVATAVAAAWATTSTGRVIDAPEALTDFVYYFDSRDYADLIA